MGYMTDGDDTDDRREIKIINNTDEIEKFRCGLLLQGEDSITEYYSEVKRCNDVVKLYPCQSREEINSSKELRILQRSKVKDRLNKQALYQIYKPPPLKIITVNKNCINQQGNPNRDASSDVIIITEEFAKRLGLYRSRFSLVKHPGVVDFPCEK
ncbi:unnamed protein product [Rhizophagus irregularis]|nr:unnamed protein product [Rhizophagus irregularis]